MRDRFLAITGVLVTVIAVLALAPVLIEAQAPAKSGAFKTPWGDPDLQGEWSGITTTPMERPIDGRVVITDPEILAEEYDKNPAETGRGVGTYNAFWRDYGKPVEGRESLIIDPPDGRKPALTPEGKVRAGKSRFPSGGAANPEDRSPNERCINWEVVIEGGVSTWYRIVQTPGYVAINQYRMHDMRIVPLDNRPHLPEGVTGWQGDSRGRWEGDTLVVETRNFNGKQFVHGSSDKLRVIERFTRVDADTIRYEATLIDPTTWEKPWTFSNPLRRDTEGFYEYGCHEGNHSMTGMLSGTRAEEKKIAQ
jgi:hypothetical protein